MPPAPRAACRGANQDPARLRAGRTNGLLFQGVGAGLARRGILIAGAAAAADRTDQLAAVDNRKSAGARDQAWIERGDIGMAGFERVIEPPGLAPKARP